MWNAIEAKILGPWPNDLPNDTVGMQDIALRHLKATSDVTGAAIRLAVVIGVLAYLRNAWGQSTANSSEGFAIVVAGTFFFGLSVSLGCRLLVVILLFFFSDLLVIKYGQKREAEIAKLSGRSQKFVKIMGIIGGWVGRSFGLLTIALSCVFIVYLTVALADLSQNFFQ